MDVDEMIRGCDLSYLEMNDSECEFIDDISIKLIYGDDFTEREIDKLRSIYERVTGG